jgi:hypothetical protein
LTLIILDNTKTNQKQKGGSSSKFITIILLHQQRMNKVWDKMLTRKVPVVWMLIAGIYLYAAYYYMVQLSKWNKFIRSYDSTSIQNKANPSLLLGTPTTTIQSPISSRLDNSIKRNIMYIHVGKTGGATLKKVFRSSCYFYFSIRLKNLCLEEFNKNEESLLSTKIETTIHTSSTYHKIDKQANQTTSFLFTIRNPVSRFVSAYDMSHPKNMGEAKVSRLRNKFYDCFPTIKDMVDQLNTQDRDDSSCYDFGVKCLNGDCSGMVMGHNGGYREYTKQSSQKYPEKEILAIRTEALWHDTQALNVALGGREDAYVNITGSKSTHGSESYVVKSDKLSLQDKETLCCYLYKESEIYEDILRKAQNLRSEEVEQSLQILYNDCGIIDRHDNFSWFEWAKSKGCSVLYEQLR